MREWLVIESSYKNCVFASDEIRKNPIWGYIPRDTAEKLLNRDLGGTRTIWFTRNEGELMRNHPEWCTELPEWSPLGFWSK